MCTPKSEGSEAENRQTKNTRYSISTDGNASRVSGLSVLTPVWDWSMSRAEDTSAKPAIEGNHYVVQE